MDSPPVLHITLVHGATAQPVLTRYERALASARAEWGTGSSQP
jgi:hypothetical protein